jgi:hypothetical protein
MAPSEDVQAAGIVEAIKDPDVRGIAAMLGLQGEVIRRTIKEATIVLLVGLFLCSILVIAVVSEKLQ